MFNQSQRQYAITTAVVLAVSLLSVFTAGIEVRAASNSDMNTVAPGDTGQAIAAASSSNNNNDTSGQKIILTASASPRVSPGKDGALIVTAHTENGTAVAGADIQVQVTDYNNHTQQINARGATDKTGDFSTKIAIPDNAKTGQWLIVVLGDKPGFSRDSISTGFAVTDFKAKDATVSAKCSGSSCK